MTSHPDIQIATWNVNSVQARLPHLTGWLARQRPDIVLLQELKCVTDAFPRAEIEEMGYHVAAHGQKTYNGVAILSRFPLEDVSTTLPHSPCPDDARYIEAVIAVGKTVLRVGSVYVPNGGSPDAEKFATKLAFLEALADHMETLISYDEWLIMGGDYNVAPEALDVYDPRSLEGSICFHPEERRRFRRICSPSIHDAFRMKHPTSPAYSWWDYRAAGWQQNRGMRIDHLLLSSPAADRLKDAWVDTQMRAEQRASDHAPVACSLSLEPI